MAKAPAHTALPPAPAANTATAAAPVPPLVHANGDTLAASASDGLGAELREAPGARTPDVRTPAAEAVAQRIVEADPEAVNRALLPGSTGPVPTPLPAVQPWGTKGDAKPAPAVLDPAFDRRWTIEALVRHPNAEVRQRAEEAQASLHHGAADSGVLMRAAIDTARAAERTR